MNISKQFKNNLEMPKLKSGQSSNNKIRMMRDTSMNIEMYVHTDSEFYTNSTLITRCSSQKRIFPFSLIKPNVKTL